MAFSLSKFQFLYAVETAKILSCGKKLLKKIEKQWGEDGERKKCVSGKKTEKKIN